MPVERRRLRWIGPANLVRQAWQFAGVIAAIAVSSSRDSAGPRSEGRRSPRLGPIQDVELWWQGSSAVGQGLIAESPGH
jgi:hypothetical protein